MILSKPGRLTLVLLCCLILASATVLTADDAVEWFHYGPGTLTCAPATQKWSGGPVQAIVFRPDPQRRPAYWCGAGVTFSEPSTANRLEFYVRANMDRRLDIKIHDSKGQAGQYHAEAGEYWSKVVLRREHAEWLHSKSLGPRTDIVKFDIIFNNSQFESEEPYELLVAGVRINTVTPRPLLNPNWRPEKTPPPVPGYRIETCIHDCWGAPDAGNFPGINCDEGVTMVTEIIDKLVAEYGNVGFTVAYPERDHGRKYAEHVKARGAIPFAEGHNGPGGGFLDAYDARAVDSSGSKCISHDGHEEDMTDPLVLVKVQEKILKSARTGVKAWRSVDYVWQWVGGPIWGYSDHAIKRWRENLQEIDVGLEIVEGDTRRKVHFWEYFESYRGHRLTPENFGLDSWVDYYPPGKDASPMAGRNNVLLFSLLFHYEWLKFLNEAHRPAAEAYECLAQPTCNPEYHDNGTDLYWLLRLAFVRGFCTEWWASVSAIIPTYYNGRYFDNVARKHGKEIVLLGETGAAGSAFMNAPNYWDNMAAYLVYYSQAGSVDAKAAHDQYWAASWDWATDPTKKQAYQAYCSFRSSWCGFLQCRNDRAVKPRADLLAIGMRPVSRRDIDSFDRGPADQPFNLTHHLRKLNYLHDGAAFPLREAFDLQDYKTILFSACEPPKGFAEQLGKWVREQAGRTVITHSFIPTRHCEPHEVSRPNRYAFLQEGGQEQHLGFERITEGKIRAGVVKTSEPAFREALGEFVGTEVKFARPLCETTGGRVLVTLGAAPLVTERKCGKGRIIYIHSFPQQRGVLVRRLEAAILDGTLRYLGGKPMAITPPGVLAIRFDRPDGGPVFTILNGAARTETSVEGRTHRVFQAQNPEAKGTVRLFVGEPNGQHTVTDVITGETAQFTSDDDGNLPVPFDGWNMRGVYVD